MGRLQSAAVRALRWDPLNCWWCLRHGDNSFGYLRLSRYLVYCCYLYAFGWGETDDADIADVADAGNRDRAKGFLVPVQMIELKFGDYFCGASRSILFSVLAIFISLCILLIMNCD